MADFSQQNSGSTSWTQNLVDYTVNGLTYDNGGNILTMKQKGLVDASPATVDSLTYQYFTNSNPRCSEMFRRASRTIDKSLLQRALMRREKIEELYSRWV